jgi:hypothetical protein
MGAFFMCMSVKMEQLRSKREHTVLALCSQRTSSLWEGYRLFARRRPKGATFSRVDIG